MDKKSYEELGKQVGSLVDEKNRAYGSSFAESHKILSVLYPSGILPDQYTDALAIVRVLDKLFRIANKKDAFGESPWRDIAGYALLGLNNHEGSNNKNDSIEEDSSGILSLQEPKNTKKE